MKYSQFLWTKPLKARGAIVQPRLVFTRYGAGKTIAGAPTEQAMGDV
jgi:hypothetical protein